MGNTASHTASACTSSKHIVIWQKRTSLLFLGSKIQLAGQKRTKEFNLHLSSLPKKKKEKRKDAPNVGQRHAVVLIGR